MRKQNWVTWTGVVCNLLCAVLLIALAIWTLPHATIGLRFLFALLGAATLADAFVTFLVKHFLVKL